MCGRQVFCRWATSEGRTFTFPENELKGRKISLVQNKASVTRRGTVQEEEGDQRETR